MTLCFHHCLASLLLRIYLYSLRLLFSVYSYARAVTMDPHFMSVATGISLSSVEHVVRVNAHDSASRIRCSLSCYCGICFSFSCFSSHYDEANKFSPTHSKRILITSDFSVYYDLRMTNLPDIFLSIRILKLLR